jgi:type I restriction-modification system DNA methylase subunit
MTQATLSTEPYVNSNLFSNYYLSERVDDLDEWDCDTEARTALEELSELWNAERGTVEQSKEDELLDNWMDEVLEILGFEGLQEPTLPGGGGYVDRLLFESVEDRRDAQNLKATGNAAGAFGQASALLEAKQWDADFSTRFSEERPYRDASHQVKHYLERTPQNLQWGILTNGRRWRLYGTKDYETETFYEVDLPELIESGDVQRFKYFFCFFRPDAFHESAGTTFLDTVWKESERASQELGEDLQDNVFTALRMLGKGFAHTNDLDIDPDDDAALAELKEQSLVLLYRLMFVLYAESRDLIDPDDPARRDEYEEYFSLDAVRLEVHERIQSGEDFDAYSTRSTRIWNRLDELFELIDSGDEELGIPPYNGGLFDPDAHEFLSNHEVSDRYIAEVIYRLATTEADDGSFALADYADLDTRHLGSIYEGLLEHEFEIAPEEYAAVADDGGQTWKPASEVSVADAVETVESGGLYVVNDEGERKATGSYYTPDYVVTYIVEETVDPLLADIESDLTEEGYEEGTQEYVFEFSNRVLDLSVLDPAMGSGHFLTRATGYLAEQVMSRVRDLETATVFDEQDIRRRVSKECIYGVDLNGMAVELAKLSMWLETLSADQPLAFLDHHLKTGNSLVGSDITAVLSNGEESETGQLTLQQSFRQTREQALSRVNDRMEELLDIDNETLDDIQQMKATYAEIREDQLYRRLFQMANVHTADQFGLDVPGNAIQRMAEALIDEDDGSAWDDVAGQDWFRSAQAMADEEGFFHWELEFPEVLLGEGESGFDAVIGNPPYVKIQNIRGTQEALADYAVDFFDTSTGRFDLYSLFVEVGSSLARDARLSFILPNKFFESSAGEGLREFLTRTDSIHEILDFGQYQVFEGATTYTCILSLRSGSEEFDYGEVVKQPMSISDLRQSDFVTIEAGELDEDKWILTGAMERQVLKKLENAGTPLGEMTEYLSEGIVSGDNKVLFVELLEHNSDYSKIQSQIEKETREVESQMVHPLAMGDEINRYESPDVEMGVIYPYTISEDSSEIIPERRLESEYPKTYDYLIDHKDRLANRGSENMSYPKWYALWCPREKELFESKKLMTPDICQHPKFTIDDHGDLYFADTAYGIVPQSDISSQNLLPILNSSVTWFYIFHTSPVLRGGFRRFKTSYLANIPTHDAVSNLSQIQSEMSEDVLQKVRNSPVASDSGSEELFGSLSSSSIDIRDKRKRLNLDLLDYFANYRDGQTLADAGLLQPISENNDPLKQTTDDLEKLKLERVRIDRDGTDVTIHATARYKPENDDEYETDRWGYTETDFLPAMRLVNLTETEADLIEAFVPVAVEEAGGFANFRDNATRTNSPLDRLKQLTLPKVADVEDDLRRYEETKEYAEELDAKIEQTDALIDQIVYDLYDLTDEEIEIVEAAVSE